MVLPPFLPYAFKRLPGLVTPPLAVYVLQRVAAKYFPQVATLSTSVLVACYALSFPVALWIRVTYASFVNHRAARALGAVMPPVQKDPSPGHILTLMRLAKNFKSGYLAADMELAFERLGHTFNIRPLFEDRIFTCEPENIKAVLATDFEDWEKGENLRSTMYSLLGVGVFAADGDMWKFHRTMTRPFFTRDRISHFELFDRHASHALSKMKNRLAEGHPVNFQDVVSRFTLDSATEFLFGKDVKSLDAPLPYPFYYYTETGTAPTRKHESDEFATAFGEAQNIVANRARLSEHWALFEPFKNKTDQHMKIVYKYLDPMLKEAVAKKKAKEAIEGEQKDKDVEDGETFLEHLVRYTDDYVILRDAIMNLAVAGRDTTASLLSFTVYHLSQHPQVLSRLRNEILEKVGPVRRPTFDDFRDMKYLRAVLNETLRLFPPVPYNIRESKRGTLFRGKPGSQPYYVPPKTRISYSVFLMQRRKDLWGPDALQFDPDRFIDERLQKYLTPNPFIFLPFNAGPRICLGQQFAYNEASFFLVRLLQTFDKISLATEAQPPDSRPPPEWLEEGEAKAAQKIKCEAHLTMHVKGGLWVRMEEVETI